MLKKFKTYKTFISQNRRKGNMLELWQIKNKLSSKKGFSLLEILAASVILLVVAGIVSQLLQTPNKKIEDLEQRAVVMNYLDAKFTEITETNPYPTTVQRFCSDQSACNNSVCGTSGTNYCTAAFSANGDCDGAVFPSPNKLSEILQAHPTMCYVQVTVDPTCDPNFSSPGITNAKQICARAKWLKGASGEVQNEFLTTFVYRP